MPLPLPKVVRAHRPKPWAMVAICLVLVLAGTLIGACRRAAPPATAGHRQERIPAAPVLAMPTSRAAWQAALGELRAAGHDTRAAVEARLGSPSQQASVPPWLSVAEYRWPSLPDDEPGECLFYAGDPPRLLLKEPYPFTYAQFQTICHPGGPGDHEGTRGSARIRLWFETTAQVRLGLSPAELVAWIGPPDQRSENDRDWLYEDWEYRHFEHWTLRASFSPTGQLAGIELPVADCVAEWPDFNPKEEIEVMLNEWRPMPECEHDGRILVIGGRRLAVSKLQAMLWWPDEKRSGGIRFRDRSRYWDEGQTADTVSRSILDSDHRLWGAELKRAAQWATLAFRSQDPQVHHGGFMVLQAGLVRAQEVGDAGMAADYYDAYVLDNLHLASDSYIDGLGRINLLRLGGRIYQAAKREYELLWLRQYLIQLADNPRDANDQRFLVYKYFYDQGRYAEALPWLEGIHHAPNYDLARRLQDLHERLAASKLPDQTPKKESLP